MINWLCLTEVLVYDRFRGFLISLNEMFLISLPGVRSVQMKAQLPPIPTTISDKDSMMKPARNTLSWRASSSSTTPKTSPTKLMMNGPIGSSQNTGGKRGRSVLELRPKPPRTRSLKLRRSLWNWNLLSRKIKFSRKTCIWPSSTSCSGPTRPWRFRICRSV